MKPDPTPLTSKFIHDLKENLKSQVPPVRKTRLAELLGTSKQSLQRWFSGTRRPSSEFILKIQELIRNKFNLF